MIMKKIITKITGILMALVMTAGMALPLCASAEESTVKVYFKNSANWEKIYCYTWQGEGGTGKGWPGTEMTELGDGWYTFDYISTKPLNCIFNDNGQPKPVQTSNHTPKDLAIDKGAYWFVASSDVQESGDGMSSGYTVTISDTAPADFPAVAPETTSSPETGNTSAVPSTIALSACGLCLFVIGMKKKTSER